MNLRFETPQGSALRGECTSPNEPNCASSVSSTQRRMTLEMHFKVLIVEQI
jgi:hypothetical protein